ncbi:MAG: deoxyribodipyrimidine photo-lyase [Hyphomonadaceae bacterium]|nr:deoxyribodipyrimidine photo-lyase [Hyphomonadaceae bacterium]
MTADAPALVWFRQDLRLADNPAFAAAAASKRPIACCYILDDETPGPWRLGGASRWWLHHSLTALTASLEKHGGRLILRRGAAAQVLPQLAAELGASAVYWNRCYEPYAVARDKALKEKLGAAGVEVKSFNGALLHEPWEIKNKTGEPFKVFTPFWRACVASGAARTPIAAPKRLEFAATASPSDALESWALRPSKPNWAKSFETEWRPGEDGARAALKAFLGKQLADYSEARNQLGVYGTSRLSPHLHFGEISPAQIAASIDPDAPGAGKFLSEIGWREFSHQLLFHWPNLPERNWKDQFDAFPWRDDEAGFRAWTRGETGYPVVDAAMRELWVTGYMHNRARMIAASFLIKHLLIDWRRGEAWFWDTLLDADLANNAASWQWVAGSGADASPYFRIFNPITQGQRYDADGAYVRRWLPDLAKLPNEYIHAPWTAPTDLLRTCGVKLGETYPHPIVDHAEARAGALAAFATI